MDKLMNQQVQARHSAEETYSAIRGCIITAQNKVATAVKTTMVFAYHEIVKQVPGWFRSVDFAACTAVFEVI